MNDVSKKFDDALERIRARSQSIFSRTNWAINESERNKYKSSPTLNNINSNSTIVIEESRSSSPDIDTEKDEEWYDKLIPEAKSGKQKVGVYIDSAQVYIEQSSSGGGSSTSYEPRSLNSQSENNWINEGHRLD